jgi:hypothetical protein
MRLGAAVPSRAAGTPLSRAGSARRGAATRGQTGMHPTLTLVHSGAAPRRGSCRVWCGRVLRKPCTRPWAGCTRAVKRQQPGGRRVLEHAEQRLEQRLQQRALRRAPLGRVDARLRLLEPAADVVAGRLACAALLARGLAREPRAACAEADGPPPRTPSELYARRHHRALRKLRLDRASAGACRAQPWPCA